MVERGTLAIFVKQSPEKRIALVSLHGAVLLFALSGLFAKWLNLPAIDIAFGRALFAAIAIAILFVVTRRHSLKINRRQSLVFLLTGALLAIHWGSFFQAIQLSTVALGLLTFATFPVFVVVLESIFFREPLTKLAFLLMIMTVFGVYLVLPLKDVSNVNVKSCYWGIASAFSFAILTLANRKFVRSQSAKKVAFYQNGFAALCLLPFITMPVQSPSSEQWYLLMILGVVFTAFSHSLFNFSLKNITAYTASIAVSLEPIYGIIAACFLLDETMTTKMLIGGAMILCANVLATKN